MDKTNLRIALVTDDDVIFSPYMVNEIIKKFKNIGTITNVVILNKIHNLSAKQKQQSIDLYGRFNNFLLSLYTKLRISANKYDKNSYSLENVLLKYSIPFAYFEDIDCADTINYLKGYDLDLILVMSHQILKSEILSLPKLGCINRHPGKLPDYAGMLPIFWAMLLTQKNIEKSSIGGGISVFIKQFMLWWNELMQVKYFMKKNIYFQTILHE